jgi:hypothetical protein
MFSLKPEHASALREEAFKRATAAGRSQLDTGAILREILDTWIAKRR